MDRSILFDLFVKQTLNYMVIYYQTSSTSSNSLKSIGFHFGGRDHSTVIHAVQSVNDMIDTDSVFRNNIKEINKRISM